MTPSPESREAVIKPSQVRVGVYVRIPLPWMHHSFLTSAFLVTTETQVREIAALGVDVMVDVKKSKVAPLPIVKAEVSDPVREAELAQLRASQEAAVIVKRERAAAMDAMRTRLDSVQKTFTSASEETATAIRQLGARPKESIQALAKVSGESTRALLEDVNSTILVMTNQGIHHTDAAHAMSVMTLSLLLAKNLGEPEAALLVIGNAALLHDVGIGSLGHSLVRNPARNRHEEAAYQEHCRLGFEQLRSIGSGMTPQVLEIALNHHEREDGKGYPGRKAPAAVSQAAKIVGIADRFDELTNPVDYAHALSPFEALATMWARERASFNENLLQHFIRAMGVYPPGTLVQLSDGRVGIVIAAAPLGARLCPQVLIYDPGTPKREAIIIDLAQGNPNASHVVKVDKALRMQDRGEDELDYLLPRRKMSWFRAGA